MSPAQLAWTAVGAVAAAVAIVRLLRASNQPEPPVKNGYRWLAVAAGCWGAGGIAQQLFGGLIGGSAPLRVADLVSLAALPSVLIGLATLSTDVAEPDDAPDESSRPRRKQNTAEAGSAGQIAVGQALVRPVPGIVVDSCLLVASLFVIGWVTIFGPDYAGADVGAPVFMLDLIRPITDLIALGLLAPFAVRSLRLTLLPALALAACTVGDCLAVAVRISGSALGTGPNLAWIIGLCLLAATPALAGQALAAPALAAPHQPDRHSQRPGWLGSSWSSPATLTALGAAAAAALVVIGYSAGGGPVASPALAVAGSGVVLVLVLRLAGLARQSAVATATAQRSDRMFRALAETTSDAVLVCDLAGSIEYASPAVADYGYSPARLAGTQLADLIHPEDRLAGIRAALAGLRVPANPDGRDGGGGGAGNGDGVRRSAAFVGRVRSADGSWRHVESALSRYGQTGEPALLLITARDVSDRIALRRQLAHLTFHDGLTGLPNRAFVEDRVKDLLDQAGPVSGPDSGPAVIGAILVDLDGYTAVNDLIGHGGGDLLLAQAGRRLRAAAPPQAMVARWSGDEFAILVADALCAQDVIDLAERLAGRIAAEPFSAAGKEIPLTVSVGVALADPGTADLLSNAEVAMSRAKEAGGGRVEVFAAQMHADVLRRLELATELQRAITGQQLRVEYQPVVDLATSRVVAVEALVRWSRDGQLIPPSEFLSVAEDSGLIVPLGDWVLREACQQVAAWRGTGWEIGLSVNFSVRQVSAPGFAASVLAGLAEARLAPEALTLEVTERVLVDSTALMVAELTALRGKGVRLAIDDFGTGYASLAFLRRLAVDLIKIDPEFVAGLGTDPTLTLLTRTIIGVGHDLGIEVIAEGIERSDQLEQLRAMGCHLGQGFLVARPMTARAVAAMAADLESAGPLSDAQAGAQAGTPACSPAS